MGRVEIGRDSKNRAIVCEYSDEWSMRDFSNAGQIFAGRRKELDGLVIYSSCFWQEELDVDVFPSDVQNLTLVHCNVDNVNIPKGVTLIEQRPRKRIQIQNDLRPWEIDDKNLPVRLVNEKAELLAGRSIDLAEIPKFPLADPADLPSKFDFAKAFQAFEPEPSEEELLALDSLAVRELVAVQAGKRQFPEDDLTQIIEDEINRLSSMKLKMAR